MFTAAALLAAAAAATMLLYAAWCAFTHGKFTLFDYGVYTNAIWNCGHGEPFRLLVEHSYLSTHLSFTLALLGPFFRLWDHPFLLSVLQWAMLVGGAALAGRTMQASGVAADRIAALLFFMVAYPFAQSVCLSEFHGVAAYFLLIPWLHACLRRRRGLVWMPLLLLLGLREDAFLNVVPMLLYFAAVDRWRAGYFYAAGSIAYGWLAITQLYPFLNGISIHDRRRHELSPEFGAEDLQRRATALAPALLPMLAGFGRRARWLPVLLFPLVPLIVNLSSGMARQHAFRLHYPAAYMACLVAGLAESLCRFAEGQPCELPAARRLHPAALYLVALTVAAHVLIGYLPAGGRNLPAYTRPNPSGRHLLRMASTVPSAGVLHVPHRLAGYVANRRDLRSDKGGASSRDFDVMFGDVRAELSDPLRRLMRGLRDGSFGVRAFDGRYFIAQRAHDPARNTDLIRALTAAATTVRVAATECDAGSNVVLPGVPAVRHWNGLAASNRIIRVAHGLSVDLPQGPHEAWVHLCMDTPRRHVFGHAGRLVLRLGGEKKPLLNEPLPFCLSPPPAFRVQRFAFDMPRPGRLEPRILAGDAPLWLRAIEFVPAPPGG